MVVVVSARAHRVVIISVISAAMLAIACVSTLQCFIMLMCRVCVCCVWLSRSAVICSHDTQLPSSTEQSRHLLTLYVLSPLPPPPPPPTALHIPPAAIQPHPLQQLNIVCVSQSPVSSIHTLELHTNVILFASMLRYKAAKGPWLTENKWWWNLWAWVSHLKSASSLLKVLLQ